MELDFVKELEKRIKSRVGKIVGVDTEGKEYSSLSKLWSKVLLGSRGEEWYAKANAYWDSEANCPCSDDGVLGGYGSITPTDIHGSQEFLQSLRQDLGLHFHRVADCGAGVGRISKNLLLPLFQYVDLVEQSPRLLAAAPAYIGVTADSDRITLIQQGLQDFAPSPGTYNVIWIQWVIGHLYDADFITFLQRAVNGLTPDGVVIIKDNVITDPDQTFVLDLTDYSVCRHYHYLKTLLAMAGVEVVKEVVQQGFPSELYPVYMIALRPSQPTSSS